jgi:multidrug transporter EmrE-like cation transporter
MKTNGALKFLFGYWLLSVATSVAFKQGGTDSAHRLWYFIGGNALGITSTWFLMRTYTRINVNVAMVLAMSVAFIATQVLYWLLYRADLTFVQWFGIFVVAAGTVMAAWHPSPAPANAAATVADGGVS